MPGLLHHRRRRLDLHGADGHLSGQTAQEDGEQAHTGADPGQNHRLCEFVLRVCRELCCEFVLSNLNNVSVSGMSEGVWCAVL